MSNELKHYGVLGMHWGRRMASASRYESARRSGMSKEAARKKIETENISTAKTVSDHASTFTREGGNIARSVRNIRSTKNKEDISKLTDAQLREKVNRMNLEQQYSNLSSSRISNGEAYVQNTMSVVGSALAISSSALGIALAIKQLRG
jgi:hypothetical protein